MKRIICTLLGVILMLYCAVIAFAETTETTVEEESPNPISGEIIIEEDVVAADDELRENYNETTENNYSQDEFSSSDIPIAEEEKPLANEFSDPSEESDDELEYSETEDLTQDYIPVETVPENAPGESETPSLNFEIQNQEEEKEEFASEVLTEENKCIVPPAQEKFISGYVCVHGGTIAYKEPNRQEEVGIFSAASFAYAELSIENDVFEYTWLKLVFDTSENKEKGMDFESVFVLGQNVSVLSEQEIQELFYQINQNNTVYYYKGSIIPIAHFEPLISREIEKSNAEQIAEPDTTTADEQVAAHQDDMLSDGSAEEQQTISPTESMADDSVDDLLSDPTEQEVLSEDIIPADTNNQGTDEIMNLTEASNEIQDDASEPKTAVVLSQPANFLVYQSTINSVRMTWDEVEGAEYYELFRKTGESKSWNKVKNVYGEHGSNLNLESGTTYSYRIRAVAIEDGTKIYGLYSDVASVLISNGKISNLSVERNSLTGVALNWGDIPDAYCYELYRKTGEDGLWSKVKTVYTNSTSNQNLSADHTYYYKVRALFKTQYGVYAGEFCEDVFINFYNTKPENLTVRKVTSSSVRLEWDKVEGSHHYELFRDTNGSGTWKKIKNISGEVGSNLNLEFGNTYSYKIRSVFVNSSKTYTGEFSDLASIAFCADISEPVIERVQQVGTNRVYISWGAVEKADEYYLYRCDNGGKWTKIKTTAEPHVYNLALKDGVKYQYKVTAVMNQIESMPSNIVDFSLGDAFVTVENLGAVRYSDNRVTLTWTDETKWVDGYTLYRRVGNGEWSKIKNFVGQSTTNLNLDFGEVYSYYIRGYRSSDLGVYYSLPSNIVLYWNQKITGLSISGTVVSWDEVIDAEMYRIFADGYEIGSAKTNSYTLSDEQVGCTISVIAQRSFENGIVESSQSDGIVFKQPDNAKFRALLVGETAYSTRLNGPDNDIVFMQSMLNGLSNKYDVVSQENATFDEIVDLIDITFSGATNDDVSLFYYSGHGVTGAGEYYSGALQTVDYQYLTTGDLAEILSNIPGRVIVILDSCGSGAAISDGTESTSTTQSFGNNTSVLGTEDPEDEGTLTFDAEQFNTGVINAFSSYDYVINSSSKSSRAGELKQTKFYVITGSAYEEDSLTTMIDGVWGGVLTRGVAYGVGCTYPAGAYSGNRMPADTSADDGISFLELATYCRNYAGNKQHVLSYSASPNYVIFRR